MYCLRLFVNLLYYVAIDGLNIIVVTPLVFYATI